MPGLLVRATASNLAIFPKRSPSMPYERDNIQAMTGYVPGEQPKQTGVIKLNTNENPYPAPAAVAEALEGIRVEQLRRYPSPLADGFRQAAADYHALSPEHFMATNGGDELLRLAVTTFVEPGRAIGVAEPSYSLYPVLADIHDCPVVKVSLAEDWSLPDDYADRLNEAGVQLAFVVNPHAPSGHLLGVDVLTALARAFDGVLVIDEAYVDFIDPEYHYSTLPLVQSHDNVLVLRTLSKGYSLAGLRFAYGIGAPSLLAPMLYKTRDSYNTDFISQELATAALRAHGEAAVSWAKVRKERSRLYQALTGRGFDCVPGQANFLLATCPAFADMSAEQTAFHLYGQLKKAGILIRYFDQPRLRDKLRITVGTPEENDALLSQLARLLDAG